MHFTDPVFQAGHLRLFITDFPEALPGVPPDLSLKVVHIPADADGDNLIRPEAMLALPEF
ncbi:MAG TPA: hypothetical protein VNQ79_01265 [Blastocatellia bacterium]|nr:hypothetical protein [Blastocatellia bacterium]